MINTVFHNSSWEAQDRSCSIISWPIRSTNQVKLLKRKQVALEFLLWVFKVLLDEYIIFKYELLRNLFEVDSLKQDKSIRIRRINLPQQSHRSSLCTARDELEHILFHDQNNTQLPNKLLSEITSLETDRFGKLKWTNESLGNFTSEILSYMTYGSIIDSLGIPQWYLAPYSSRSSECVLILCICLHVSRNPVVCKMEFLTRLRSLPLSVLPLPMHTENAIFSVIRRATITCGGITLPSLLLLSSSTLQLSLMAYADREGIFMGSDSFLWVPRPSLALRDTELASLSHSFSGHKMSGSWNSSMNAWVRGFRRRESGRFIEVSWGLSFRRTLGDLMNALSRGLSCRIVVLDCEI